MQSTWNMENSLERDLADLVGAVGRYFEELACRTVFIKKDVEHNFAQNIFAIKN